jgi:hypothetical protein
VVHEVEKGGRSGVPKGTHRNRWPRRSARWSHSDGDSPGPRPAEGWLETLAPGDPFATMMASDRIAENTTRHGNSADVVRISSRIGTSDKKPDGPPSDAFIFHLHSLMNCCYIYCIGHSCKRNNSREGAKAWQTDGLSPT